MEQNNIKRKRHSPIGIRGILFVSIALFALLIVIVIWFIQSIMMNVLYRNTKINEINESIDLINYSDDSSFEQMCYFTSLQYKLCLRVFSVNNGFEEVISSDFSADCIIHKLPEDEFLLHYENAKQNAGSFIYNTNSDSVLSSEGTKIKNATNIIYSTILQKAGNEYLFVFDAHLLPLMSISPVLNNQFIIIAIFVLMATFTLALYLSRIISYPLSQMNAAAKQLALGNYNVTFEGRSCKETYELSKSLNHASSELAKINTLQNELIANVSHDLRTPLTLIGGYAEMMRDLPGENSPENAQVIIDETEHLSSLVNDMLDLSRINTGTLIPEFDIFDLTEALCEVMARYKKFTNKNGFSIDFIYDSHVSINADKTMILQVVYNFINNAINYSTDIKEVTVTQEVTGGWVTISVTDKGEGISEENLKYIWDRYYKLDKNHNRPKIGTGLGLSIAKDILRNHSATFGVTSKLGIGSSFYFSLPVVMFAEVYEENKNN